ncbi:MAG: hypothetical protein ABI693_29375, partial [Bryobacteraceae bacterium]
MNTGHSQSGRIVATLLSVAVFLFALQPCLASPAPARTYCCSSPVQKCHRSSRVENCVMSGNVFAQPED